jgi:hypothetical protein
MSSKLVHVLAPALLILVGVPIPAWSQSPRLIRGALQGSGRPIPLPIIDACRCSATVFVRTAGGGLTQQPQTKLVTDVVGPGAPRDTCPVSSRLDVEWHAEPFAVTGYRYKLDEPDFIAVGPNVRSVTYDSVPPPVGTKVFTLGARGPAGTYTDSTRRFRLNYAPDTWWSGPDPNSPSLQTKPNGERYALLVGGRLSSAIVGSLLSDDSTQVFPAARPERRTFFEIWKDTVYVRQEGDTVHMNSWAAFHGGGFDRDSRYAVRVSDLGRQLPGFPGGPVLEPGPANGSPVGFRFSTSVLLPQDIVYVYPTTTLFPDFDPNDVLMEPHIGGYQANLPAGRLIAVMRAEDGDGQRDLRVSDAVALVRRVENGTATPEEQALRSKVLTYYVDRAPYFLTGDPLFRPTPMQTFGTSQWNLNLIANDEDPWSIVDRRVGGPTGSLTLRRKIRVHGKDLQGNDLTYVDPNDYINQQNITVNVPANLKAGPCEIEVELCDCISCEVVPGSGRCIVARFAVIYAPPGEPTSMAAVAAPAGGLPAPKVTTRTLLFAPYPNPANRGATFRWNLAVESGVDVALYNLAGQRIRHLASGELPAGEHSRTWNGLDDAGQPVGAGLYFIRLRIHEGTLTRKVFVTR